ncbi:thioredoxin domain-containing protein [Cyanobium sp. Morenito 9A2]|uniref:thioredoxin domain-containing protein n=1 Tax=Cyanobium sp. Morenito 9A2 TaxID=2823718 RepID=UPI0020CE7A12|nr:thioredoxin domain-containing protein [Cyanobium sp. Morenito 9A2]MCP9849654.1 thioredoxin [Cyanobium sp. Morenito 9A2]
MTGEPSPSPSPAAAALGQRERFLLAVVAVLLAVLVFLFQGGLRREAPLERLARQSLDLPVALSDGRPTLVEFYADWCEACRAMAPAMEVIEDQHHRELDVVLLNVDNPRWQGELERYEVNGIPQLELFDGQGQAIGRSLGARSRSELEALAGALIAETPLPRLAGIGSTSPIAQGAAAALAGPRSHG